MVMKLISEGAEAKIFETRLLGMATVLKRRIRKGYRIQQLDNAIRYARTKTEAKILSLATTSGVNAPKALLVDGFDLYITKITGKRPAGLTQGQAREAGVSLGRIHNLDISHGDFTPANMILGTDGKLYIIDFGLAEITKSIEQKALDLLLMKRSLEVKAFGAFLISYKACCTQHKEIISRLYEIERRGRYQTRTLE